MSLESVLPQPALTESAPIAMLAPMSICIGIATRAARRISHATAQGNVAD